MKFRSILALLLVVVATVTALLLPRTLDSQELQPTQDSAEPSPRAAGSAPSKETPAPEPDAEQPVEGTLRGTVVNTDLDPIPHLQLQVIHHQLVVDLEKGMTVSESLRKNKSKGIWVTQVVTDDAGGFSATSLAPGDYHLRTTQSGAAPVGDPQHAAGGQHPVMVQFRLTPLSIHVEDAKGQHVQDARVTIQVQAIKVGIWVTQQEFAIELAGAGGLYRQRFLGGERVLIEAEHGTLGRATQTIDIEAASQGPIRLRLDPSAPAPAD
jgi:hypothetical protein